MAPADMDGKKMQTLTLLRIDLRLFWAKSGFVREFFNIYQFATMHNPEQVNYYAFWNGFAIQGIFEPEVYANLKNYIWSERPLFL